MFRHSLATAIAAFFFSQSASATDLPGTIWATEGGESHVTFELVDDMLFGRLTWLSNEEQQGITAYDDNNPEPARQSCPLIGLPFVHSFTADGEEWVGGRIYNPRTGKTYRSTIQINDDDTLGLRGCWGPICKKQVWTFVGPAEEEVVEPAIGAAPDELAETDEVLACLQPPSDS